MKKLSTQRKERGFTLIEMLLVITLIIIIAGLSVTFYGRFMLQNATADAAERLAGSLHKAQLYSMMRKGNSQWGVKIEPDSIILFQGSSYASRNSVVDEVFSINQNIIVSGMDEIVFSQIDGLPNVASLITLTGGENVRVLDVNNQGIIE